jgi:hypothetical protein
MTVFDMASIARLSIYYHTHVGLDPVLIHMIIIDYSGLPIPARNCSRTLTARTLTAVY